jgi:hypothetical protein
VKPIAAKPERMKGRHHFFCESDVRLHNEPSTFHDASHAFSNSAALMVRGANKGATRAISAQTS